jgi:hypothetical protein
MQPTNILVWILPIQLSSSHIVVYEIINSQGMISFQECKSIDSYMRL